MELLRSVKRLAWDDWNIEHVWEQHAMTREEVESVGFGDDASAEEPYKGRVLVIGPGADTRLYTVIIGAVPNFPGVFYAFSARVASRQERRRYRTAQGIR